MAARRSRLCLDRPLYGAGIGECAIISFAFTWNEFLFAFILTYSKATP